MSGKTLRLAVAAALLLLVAVALAVVGATSTGGSPAVFKKTGDPDALAKRSASATIGTEASPDAAVAEAAAMRAYPASDVPAEAAIDTRKAWQSIAARGSSGGAWELIGPTKPTYPGVLNALGDGDQTVVSGRVTAMGIASTCTQGSCVLYVAAAGGGVWRTDKALAGNQGWQFVSGSFGTNAIGTLYVDPSDKSGNTVYAGTGEPNASGDSEAGVGIYRTTNGGASWTLLPGSALFAGRSLSSLVLAPNGDILVGVARGVRGISSVTGGATSNPPAPAPLGLYRSNDGGATFTMIWNGAGSIRGVNEVRVDPNTPTTLYASAFQAGIWRSTTNGATWTQIKAPLNGTQNTDRAEFDVAKLAGGKTRMYAGIGNQGAPAARFFRTDDAAGAAAFVDLTTAQNVNYCSGQCWYDNVVYSPPGAPDVVYLLGSYDYGTYGASSNGRGVLYSTDAGQTFTDMTWDGDASHAEAIHPDQHALVTVPGNPALFIDGTDGGVMRSNGLYADSSGKCTARGLTGASLSLCQSLLNRVPDQLYSMNEGLSTLQFQSLSVSSQRPKNLLQGGTQDNGTWEYTGSPTVWWQNMYGDGGQSGFSSADDSLRFNTFTGQASDVNFRNGDPTKWVIATGPIVSSPESALFYPPVTADPNPVNGGTIFQGSQSIWRTQDWGGDRDYLEANCPEFTTSAANPACGDFVRIGGANSNLTAASWGDRAGGNVAAIERAADKGTLWAATTTGRVFVTDNSDAAAGSVSYTRIDTLAANDPGRFVSSIYVDPMDPHHAWISYSGYNFNTPAQPGHVFEVTYNAGAGTATWTNLDGGTGPMGDLPVTDLVRDDVTGTLYAATDFGVAKSTGAGWVVAGSGLPMVEVPGLTIVPGARVLYAATHGRSAWKLNLG